MRFKPIDDRRVARTVIGDAVVSTVELPDYNDGTIYEDDFVDPSYETMVFGGSLDGEQVQYMTYEEAAKGHEEMCQRVSAAVAPVVPPLHRDEPRPSQVSEGPT